jgi:hypothetical protein
MTGLHRLTKGDLTRRLERVERENAEVDLQNARLWLNQVDFQAAAAKMVAVLGCAPDEVIEGAFGAEVLGALKALRKAGGWLAADADQVVAERDRLERLEADKARLDFLDEANRRLNAVFGTTYKWELIMNHNVNRLMIGQLDVDLNDAAPNGLKSCREAIDQRMRAVEVARRART